MYARITTYKLKVDKMDEATEKVDGMKSEIMSLPGIKQWMIAAQDDGTCIAIAVYEDRAAADANASKAKELFGRFAEYYESPPTPGGYEILQMESNQ